MVLVSMFSSIVVVLMVLKVNMRLSEPNKWDFVETLIAVVFGWIGALYILMSYFDELTTFDDTPIKR